MVWFAAETYWKQAMSKEKKRTKRKEIIDVINISLLFIYIYWLLTYDLWIFIFDPLFFYLLRASLKINKMTLYLARISRFVCPVWQWKWYIYYVKTTWQRKKKNQKERNIQMLFIHVVYILYLWWFIFWPPIFLSFTREF